MLVKVGAVFVTVTLKVYAVYNCSESVKVTVTECEPISVKETGYIESTSPYIVMNEAEVEIAIVTVSF